MSLILVATRWFLSYDEVDARTPAWGAVHRLSGTRRITGRGPEPGVCSPTFCQRLPLTCQDERAAVLPGGPDKSRSALGRQLQVRQVRVDAGRQLHAGG